MTLLRERKKGRGAFRNKFGPERPLSGRTPPSIGWGLYRVGGEEKARGGFINK